MNNTATATAKDTVRRPAPAAPSVVRIDRYIRKIPFTGIAREHILLMNDGITVPGKIIVAAQAAIDGGDFFL